MIFMKPTKSTLEDYHLPLAYDETNRNKYDSGYTTDITSCGQMERMEKEILSST